MPHCMASAPTTFGEFRVKMTWTSLTETTRLYYKDRLIDNEDTPHSLGMSVDDVVEEGEDRSQGCSL